MTHDVDATESQVRKWVLQRNGDPFTSKDVIEFGLAIDEDSVRRHDETLSIVGELLDKFDEHCVESQERDRRIEKLDEWRTGCPATMQKTVEELHNKYHNEYIERISKGDEETERKTWVMWGVGTKLGAALITIIVAIVVTIINLGLNYAWFGNP